MADRYARQRLIEWWDQDRLQAARILVAGVGALGNEVVKNLALLGVGSLLLVDFDAVDPSNLSRAVLFNETAISRPKVEVVAEAVTRLNPDVAVETINGDLFYDVGLGHYRHSHLAIGCLDNLAARSQVGLSCALAGIPHLDGGMWSLGGEVRWLMAGGGPCFDCTLSDADRERATERRSCTGFRDPAWDDADRVPTVATTAAIIGGLLAQEAAKWLCGYDILASTALVYNGQHLSLHRAALSRNPDCPSAHTPYTEVVSLPARAANLTARQLLDRAAADLNTSPDGLSLELGRDVLLAFECPGCGRSETVNQLWGRVLETARRCPHCETIRQPQTLRSVEADSPHVDRSLRSLGVPPGEVVMVYSETGLHFYELTGDIQTE